MCPNCLSGLGTVQAFNVVEIKAQVNGTLIAMPVREGQEVHQGDIVAEIDPRPYQGGARSGDRTARRGCRHCCKARSSTCSAFRTLPRASSRRFSRSTTSRPP